MDELRLLLSATGLGDRAEQLKQSLIWTMIWGLVAFMVMTCTGGLLALALYSALLPGYGAVNAALISAAVFATVAVTCGVIAWQCHHRGAMRHDSPVSSRGEADVVGLLSSLGHRDSPFRAESLWDIATLVAIGVIAGHSQRRPSQ